MELYPLFLSPLPFQFSCQILPVLLPEFLWVYISIHTGNALVQAAIFFSLNHYNDGLTGFPSISLATPQFHFLTVPELSPKIQT